MEKYSFGHTYLVHKLLVVISEIILIALACQLAIGIAQVVSDSQSWDAAVLMPVFCLGWLGLSSLGRLYDPEYIFDFQNYARSIPFVLIPQMLVAFGYLYALQMGNLVGGFVFPFYLIAVSFSLGFRWLISVGYHNRRLFFADYKIMVVGSGKTVRNLLNFFNAKRTQASWFEISPEKEKGGSPERLHNQLETIKAQCIAEGTDEMYLALPLSATSVTRELSEFCDDHHIRWRLASDFELLPEQSVTVHFFDQIPIISLNGDPLASWLNRMVKRIFDIFFSLFVLIFIFPPIYLIVGLLIKLESKGPVFFKQGRSGRKNQSFTCYKFRTMRTHVSKEYQQATKDDPRITRVGSFLRKTSLDEFPQFINVLLGHMSVVGPRPHPIKLNEIYAPKIYKYEYRHMITPGITGHAQVNGYRGETKDPGEMEKRIEYDNWYIRNWSFGLDLLIVLRTVLKTAGGDKNAY